MSKTYPFVYYLMYCTFYCIFYSCCSSNSMCSPKTQVSSLNSVWIDSCMKRRNIYICIVMRSKWHGQSMAPLFNPCVCVCLAGPEVLVLSQILTQSTSLLRLGPIYSPPLHRSQTLSHPMLIQKSIETGEFLCQIMERALSLSLAFCLFLNIRATCGVSL